MRAASPQPRLRDYAIAALLLAGAADALFFDRLGRSPGLSASVFAMLLASAVAICHRRLLSRGLAPHLLLLSLAFVALVETVDLKSLILTTLCLAAFAMAAARRLPSPARIPAALARFLIAAPLALPRDRRRQSRAQGRARQRSRGVGRLAHAWLVWVMPLAFAAGFTLLLAAGNPVLERWLALIDPLWILDVLTPMRILFWVLVVALAWPFLRPRPSRRMRPGETATGVGAVPQDDARLPGSDPVWSPQVFGQAAILRALILFNAVFGVQTLLDAAYLWGGLQLPEGIGYATYAHRGAYMLVVTALLAAAFVLVALRPDTAAAGDRRIRALVHLWIAQNVVLVLSAMLRLDLYVDVYALTHWRLAAFVWMGVVAAGLVLICVRIAGRRSNRWLIGANLAVLSLVTAGSCFVNDRALIAGFNVAHSREVSGRGVLLDVDHLVSLGPAAIPSIDRYLARSGALTLWAAKRRAEISPELRAYRDELAGEHRSEARDWRGWTFRSWRLSRYLETHAAPPVPPGPMGPFPPPVAGPN